MNLEDFDKSIYAGNLSSAIQAGRYDKAIEVIREVFTNEIPDPDLRLELFCGIAMAQVGMAQQFTEALTEEGKLLKQEFSMTAEETKQVAQILGTALKVQADGMAPVTYPNGESNATT